MDKMEAVPGTEQAWTASAFDQVNRIGISVIGQSSNLAPADKKNVRALRDVTATIGCVPLITSSIMSKSWPPGPTAFCWT